MEDQPLHLFLTEIVDLTIPKEYLKGSLCIVHGFAQCSDAFFEIALHFALNGFRVHLVDLEGHGFSGGTRIVRLTIDQFHHSVTTLLQQVDPNLPCFLMGHSMGGLTVNSYLGLNPKIAERLAGVIYSAPFLGLHEDAGFDFGKKIMTQVLEGVFGEFVLMPANALNHICSNKFYQRSVLADRKSHPFVAMGLINSFVKYHDRVAAFAHQVNYPY